MRPSQLNFLFAPVSNLKGIGPAAGKLLQKLLGTGQYDAPVTRDLLFHQPVGLIDRRQTYPLNQIPAGETATLLVTVEGHYPPPRSFRGGMKPYKVVCGNETGTISLIFFSAKEEYVKRLLPPGEQRVISGRVEMYDFQPQMPHPDVIAMPHQLEQVKTVEPVYPLTAGLTNRRLIGIIGGILSKLPALPEWIKPETVKQHQWVGWNAALQQLHRPVGADGLLPTHSARARLAYDEMLASQLYLALLRHKTQQKPGYVIPPPQDNHDRLRKLLPFALTKGQETIIGQVSREMASGNRMVRLLQGDVGSGKTMVALFAALSVMESGAQVALMAPTEIVAQQHYATFARYLEPLGYRVVLLTGRLKAAQKNRAVEDIASGAAHVVIGTHALFQESVEFRSLALAIIDEQHRFGVDQRMALTSKGNAPHLLHMTATPIPRTLTMMIYGDMECSLLREKPANRKQITTRIIPLSRYGELQEGVERALSKQEKIYWICPQIEGDSSVETADVAAAEQRGIEFTARFGPRVGVVHGRMKADARDAVMQRFARGEVQLLVATTVVEVGVDVPDATIMIIEQAERFGLSQLHQLRGRVGRGEKQSSCVLLYSDRTGEEARGRLTIMRESDDGFRIAEEDLVLRGGGDLLGRRQSGLPKFHFFDLAHHQALLLEAKEDASAVVAADASLKSARGEALQLLLNLFGYDYAI